MSPPFPSWCVLDGDASRDPAAYADQKPPLRCLRLATRSRHAWGFDAFGDNVRAGFDAGSLVRRLEIEARIADSPNLSSLTLRGGESRSGERLFPFVHAVDKNLIVFTSNLPLAPCRAYIMYDTIGKVLSMIPSQPRCYEVSRTTRPLIARRHPGYNDQSYALVLMAKTPKFAGENDVKGKGKMPEFAEEDVFLGKAKKVEFAGGEDDDDDDINWQDVLLLWPSSSSSPWKLTKTANLPNQWLDEESSFVADLTFSFEGLGFWADLLCGVLFCRCDDLLSDKVDRVDFSFIDLPPGCQADFRHTGKVAAPEAYRTLGCAGGSIGFVSIDGFLEYVNPGDRYVTLWRLLLKSNTWVKEYEISLKELWNQDEFCNANLPMTMTPMYPILSTLEEHVVYFMLGEFNQDRDGIIFPAGAYYLLQVDMSCGRILSSAPLPSACSLAPVVSGSDFISYLPPDALSGSDVVSSVVSQSMKGLQSGGGVGLEVSPMFRNSSTNWITVTGLKKDIADISE
uniref:DUF1618 domain-containing protein n=1 Tax=Oryza punctata TaxID=4537 RepID=A0A0E0KJZ1_ORYPU